MKKTILLVLALAGVSLSAAQPLAQQQFVIKKPTPKWFGERIALPPKGFAPDLGLKGIEEILFSPGMFKADQPDFFTYVFLFAVEAKPVLTSEVLQKELFTYYAGLSKARLGNPKLDTSKFSVNVRKMKHFEKKPKGSFDVASFTATVNWIEPFATRKFQTLHFELQTLKFVGSPHQYLFVCASPKPRDKAIWNTLREIRGNVALKPKP
ncbi:MAG: hypothetical protein H8E27_12285 [Verrucomicrobia subdivision 3 bacterium]|nr:hypothetical protein [Limisphaerales bacterium]